jgi:tetratricopeptide (TPR) repeat protein
LSVNIPGRPSADQHGGGTISIRQLQHKIPADAQKEFSKGITASKKGDRQSAVEHFQKAVSIDPELVEGYNNLGAAHAALGQLEQAAEQFQKAIEQVPEYTLALANLSLALCSTERYPEAEQAARRALKLDSSLSKVRYVLAVSLIAQHRDPTELVAPEVLDNLERATPEVPKARLVAADILAQAGRRDDAARQLEEYLRSTPEQDTDRQRVEAWLTHLRVQ